MCWESFIPKWRGTFVVGRIVSCPGVVLVPVGGLWRRPAAHEGHGQAFPRSLCWGCGVGRVLSRQPAVWCPPAPSTTVVMGGLHDTKPSCGVSPACRTLMSCNSPNRVAVRSELEVVRRSKCGPSRRIVPNMGCCGRRGPRCGYIGACHSALLAREPAIANGNPLSRTLTP